MFGAVTILADVQENVAAFIAAAQNVDTAEKKLLFEFRYLFFAGKERVKPLNIQGVFVGFVVGESIGLRAPK